MNKKSIIIELAIVTVALLIFTHALFILRHAPVIGSAVSTIVAIFFIYTPVIVLWKRGRALDFLDRNIMSGLKSLVVFLIAAAIIFPLFFGAAHFWQMIIMKRTEFAPAGFQGFIHIMFYQLLIVALPEEFYFRGYFQSAMNLICEKKWRILGVNLGWGWIITAAVFAAAHSIVTYQWWHFAIFFPALLFGYLRERTGSITAPILFHAASNLIMDWLARSYM